MDQDLSVYKKAAARVKDYYETHSIQFGATETEINALIEEFQNRFSPEILKNLNDDELLSYLFLSADGNNDSLCYHLEFNTKIRRIFGSISGGSSYKYGLFQRQEDGKWMTGAPKSPEELTVDEALQLGKEIRDYLVSGCAIIEEHSLASVDEYETLDDDLNSIMGKFAGYAWIQKYFNMIFPEKFIGWYVTDWLRHILLGFGIEPSSKYYGMNGQLALIKRNTKYLSPNFGDICYAMFGDIKHFYRIGSSDGESQFADEWQSKGMVAIGWNRTGDLLNYLKNGSIDRDKLSGVLEKEYYAKDKRTASRKAGEIKSFYETSDTSILTVMNGSRLIAFVDELSPYYFDDGSKMAHQKNGTWHPVFNVADTLPVDEGLLTTFTEIKKTENLLYLYKKYYYPNEVEENAEEAEEKNQRKLRYKTGLTSEFARNRILFGAPGTGKSYTLNKNCEELIGADNDRDYERVTFHPDYSYANFVGTYKPVPTKDSDGNDSITYRYVPGPFMRVYVQALKNAMSDAPRPFLLIIEEINRANVASVFGDVFQLLDRDDDEVSEYPIQATEDMKTYLSKELNVPESQCLKIRIPDNMFIWASMNSADQGVFPMDTAFKRRWNFTYLGIDDNDELLQGKYVVLGSIKRQRVEWNKLRKAINHFLSKMKINEDKQLGPYFVSKNIVVPKEGDEIDRDKFIETFKNKVIMYLFEDAAKQKRTTLFEGCFDSSNRYSEICREFDEKGIGIFHHDIALEVDPEDLPDENPAEAGLEA